MADLIMGQDGKPVFVGKEDSNNPPTQPRKGTQIECPICHDMVDFLLGNVRMGCVKCYDKSKDGEITDSGVYDTEKEML